MPFYTAQPVNGAHGSRWTTELAVLNHAAAPVTIAGYDQDCRIVCTPIPTPPGTTFYPRLGPSAMHGIFLQIHPPEAIDQVSIQLRVRDLSLQAEDWGTQVPVVAESAAPLDKFVIVDVPTDPRFRSMLRLYHFDRTAVIPLSIRYYSTTIGTSNPLSPESRVDELLTEEIVTLSAGSVWNPGYAELTDLTTRHPALLQAERVRIDVSAITPGTRIWGLVSLTNNSTQHVTLVSPQP